MYSITVHVGTVTVRVRVVQDDLSGGLKARHNRRPRLQVSERQSELLDHCISYTVVVVVIVLAPQLFLLLAGDLDRGAGGKDGV